MFPLTVQLAEDLVQQLMSDVDAPYVRAYKSSLGGEHRVSVLLTVSLDPKDDWQNGILENSHYRKFHILTDGTMEEISGHGTARFRKSRAKSEQDVVDRINAWVEKSESEMGASEMRESETGLLSAKSWATGTIDKNHLTTIQVRELHKVLRSEGITPPKAGYCVEALGGEICNHGSRLGWQVIGIDASYFENERDEKYWNSIKESKSLSKFVRAYLETALWSSTDESNESGGDPLDDNYSVSDFAPEAIEQAIKDCESFQDKYSDLLLEAGDSEQNGHDFWLTRNRHGTGFWDRGYPDEIGNALTEAAHGYGEVNAFVGDDGQIYLS